MGRFIKMSCIFRLFILFFVSLMVAAFGEESRRPNIVFIFSDDHATQSIGAYGSKINRTPNIDRLAEEGSVFLNSFCGNSICGPSRSSVLTGVHSHINGFYTNAGGTRFDSAQSTFPKLLQEAGYQTALVGKWHLRSDPTGFDYWEILPGQGSYYTGRGHKLNIWKFHERRVFMFSRSTVLIAFIPSVMASLNSSKVL